MNRGDLTKVNKVWYYFINSLFKPSKHVSTVRQDRALFLYALVKGYTLNVGRIIEQSTLDYVNEKFSGNIPHLALVTLLCIKRGVTFSDIENEKCPKASPFTLTGITKGPVENEEEERRRKRKITMEQPREPFLIVEAEDESENKESGGYEAHS